jgi:hypothetical protein
VASRDEITGHPASDWRLLIQWPTGYVSTEWQGSGEWLSPPGDSNRPTIEVWHGLSVYFTYLAMGHRGNPGSPLEWVTPEEMCLYLKPDLAHKHVLMNQVSGERLFGVRYIRREEWFEWLVQQPKATAPAGGVIQDRSENDVDTVRPAPQNLSVDWVSIDLRSEPPHLPRYFHSGPHRKATQDEIDECLNALARLDGGQTNRDVVRDWGRHWLRDHKQADITAAILVDRFNDPTHEAIRRPRGNPRYTN